MLRVYISYLELEEHSECSNRPNERKLSACALFLFKSRASRGRVLSRGCNIGSRMPENVKNTLLRETGVDSNDSEHVVALLLHIEGDVATKTDISRPHLPTVSGPIVCVHRLTP